MLDSCAVLKIVKGWAQELTERGKKNKRGEEDVNEILRKHKFYPHTHPPRALTRGQLSTLTHRHSIYCRVSKVWKTDDLSFWSLCHLSDINHVDSTAWVARHCTTKSRVQRTDLGFGVGMRTLERHCFYADCSKRSDTAFNVGIFFFFTVCIRFSRYV